MDLLVSGPRSDLYRARPAALRILKRFGDPAPWAGVTGIAAVPAAAGGGLSHMQPIFLSSP